MRQIRKGTFETNSSSCHSICIQRAPVKMRDHITFRVDEYGWETRCVGDTASYFYTALIDGFDGKEQEERVEKLKSILDSHLITYDMYGEDHWCGLDHAYAARKFVDALLNDEDLLFRFLFGQDSCVWTGNDNCCEDEDMCFCADKKIYNWDGEEYIDNPNHDEEKFEYFYKGN